MVLVSFNLQSYNILKYCGYMVSNIGRRGKINRTHTLLMSHGIILATTRPHHQKPECQCIAIAHTI